MLPILDLGFVQIPTYFFVISASVSFLLIYLSNRVDKFLVDRKTAFNIAIILMVSGFIGGRLLHVFYEEFAYYAQDPKQVLFFWNGGFVYFGGLIAGWICVWAYCLVEKISFLKWADFFTPILSLSHAFGRIGCVLTGCCFGTYCTLPWSIDGRHPTASYLVLGEFIIYGFIIYLEKLNQKKSASLNLTNQANPDQITLYLDDRKRAEPFGTLFFKWIFISSLLRYFVEFYRDDFRGRFVHFPLLGALSVSQIICVVLMLISLVFFLFKYVKTKKDKA